MNENVKAAYAALAAALDGVRQTATALAGIVPSEVAAEIVLSGDFEDEDRDRLIKLAREIIRVSDTFL